MSSSQASAAAAYSGESSSESEPAKRGYVREVLAQTGILLRKNYLIALRNKRSTFFQAVLAPVGCVIVLYLFQLLADSLNKEIPNPESFEVGAIPLCITGVSSWCYTMAYAPATPDNRAIVQYMADHGNPSLSVIDYDKSAQKLQEADVLAFNTEGEMKDFIIKHPNVTLAAVRFMDKAQYIGTFGMFNDYTFINETDTPVIYQLWYNDTLVTDGYDVRLEFTRALHEAIVSHYSDAGDFSFNLKKKKFPLVRSALAADDSVITQFAPVFFYSAIMFSFIHLLTQLVSEKENKLTEGMRVMGMNNWALWFSWLLSSAVLQFIAINLVIAFGAMFQYKVITNCNYFVTLFNFWAFSTSMIPFAYLLSALISRGKTANTVAFFIFILGFLFLFIIGAFIYILYLIPDNWVTPFFFFPPFNFAKIMNDISALAASQMTEEGTVPGPGFKFHNLYEGSYQNYMTMWPPYDIVKIPSAATNLWYQIMDFFVFSILAWYVENVFPGEFGTPKPFYFFLMPSYWGLRRGQKSGVDVNTQDTLAGDIGMDEDVREERRRVLNGECDSSAVRIVNLAKIFRSGVFKKSAFVAVDHICVSMENGQLFCLLGHNGAGKTTTINMLTGMFGPSSGEAFIQGLRMTEDMSKIREIMGVCPQHDILWPELTPREHLEIFSVFKRIPQSKVNEMVEERLAEVHLNNVQNERVSSLSGGMRRRLSVALSTVGNPKIVFMDEPTTGMDPVSRRKVWELIANMKKDRVVVLTTHSMEEADILGDRIAIMAHGQLKALGTSLHLKSRFGSGYRLGVTCAIEKVPAVKTLVTTHLPSAVLEAESAGSLMFSLPLSQVEAIPGFFTVLEQQGDGQASIIDDWGISQTTLEEVFLKVTGTFSGN